VAIDHEDQGVCFTAPAFAKRLRRGEQGSQCQPSPEGYGTASKAKKRGRIEFGWGPDRLPKKSESGAASAKDLEVKTQLYGTGFALISIESEKLFNKENA